MGQGQVRVRMEDKGGVYDGEKMERRREEEGDGVI